MLVIKKIMIVLACILMSGVRDKSEDTNFYFRQMRREKLISNFRTNGQR